MRSEKCGADQPGTARTFRDGRHNRPAERIKTARKQLLQHGAGKEDLQADGDEDDAAEDGGFSGEAGAEDLAEADAEEADHEGDRRDDKGAEKGPEGAVVCDGEAHREGVDGGGDSLKEEGRRCEDSMFASSLQGFSCRIIVGGGRFRKHR